MPLSCFYDHLELVVRTHLYKLASADLNITLNNRNLNIQKRVYRNPDFQRHQKLQLDDVCQSLRHHLQ